MGKKDGTTLSLTVPKQRALFPNADKGKREPAPFSIAGLPVQPGDMFLGDDNWRGYVRVEKLDTVKQERWVNDNPKDRRKKTYDDPHVFYRKYMGVSAIENDDDEDGKRAKAPLRDWSKDVYSDSLKRFAEEYPIRVVGTIAEFEAAAVQRFLAGPDPKETSESHETGIQAMSEGDKLEAIERMVLMKQNEVDAMNRVMASKLSAFEVQAQAMEHQMTRIRQAIGFLETYLGTWQKIYIIQEGQPAAASEPISIRQMILFMDEECGDPRINYKVQRGTIEQPGIDWQNVDDFDAWITDSPENLNRVLPEAKGVVAIRPSRQDREYSNDWRMQTEMEAGNRMAYLLVRNGENVYRIWLGDTLGERLFPMLTEFKINESDPFHWSKSKELESVKFGYQGNMALIQGVMDRTDVFKPLPHYINLNQSETWNGMINLIRDDESRLLFGDGHPRWQEWKDEINSKIVRGTRVFFGPAVGRHADRKYSFTRYYYNDFSIPPVPKAGVYTVEGRIFPDNIKGPEERQRRKPGGGPFEYEKYMWPGDDGYRLYVQYNPKDTVYDQRWVSYDEKEEPHERKNRVGWWLDVRNRQVLNYDLVTLEDIDFFLNSRLDRVNFLDMVTTLWELRDVLRKERAWEKEFVEAMASRLDCPKSAVWDAVHWWKHKTIMKRALTVDENKAWRMVEKRVTRLIGNDEEE